MITDEALSALLEGHLDLETERSMRRAVAADPALAERLARLEDLAGQLDALPPVSPPALAPVTGTVAPPSAAWHGRSFAVGALLGLAVAASLAWALTPAASTLQLGTTVVEPHGTLALSAPAEESPMKSLITHGAAVAAGAALTLAVSDGSAVVTAADGERTELRPGDQVRVSLESPSSTPPADARPQQRRVLAGSAPASPERAALEEELEQLRFENGLLQGQLQLLQGTPVPWPARYPDGIEPEDFLADLESLLPAEMPLELVRADCDEYPCIAFFTGSGEDPDGLRSSLKELGTAIGESGRFGESPGLVVQNAVADDNGDVRSVVALAVLDSDGPPAEDVSDRLDHRAEAEMEDLLQDEAGTQERHDHLVEQ